MANLYSTDRDLTPNTSTVTGEFIRYTNKANSYGLTNSGGNGGGAGDFGNTDTIGNTIERGVHIDCRAVDLYSTNMLFLRPRRTSEARGTAGARFTLDNSTMISNGVTAGWIAGDAENNTTTGYIVRRTDSDETGTMEVINGSVLYVPQSSAVAYRALMGNQGNGRWIVRDSAVTAGDDYGSPFGTNDAIFYLGYQSEFNNARLTTNANFEVQGEFKEFEDTTLLITNNSNAIGSKPYIYAAGKANTFATFTGVPTVQLTVSEPSNPVYCSIRHQHTYLGFDGGIPSDVYGWQFGIGWGGGSQNATDNNGFYLASGASATGTKLNERGVASNSDGRFVLFNVDGEPVINEDFSSGAISSRPVLWWQGVKRGFGTGNIYFPVGWPDSRAGAIRYFDAANDLGTNKAGLRAGNSTNTSNLDTNSDTTARNRNSVRRGYPFTAVSVEYGQTPFYTAAIGGTANIGTGTVANSVVKAAEDSANDVKNNFSEAHTLGYDAALAVTKVNTKTKAAAIPDVSFANTSSLLTTTVDTDGLDLTDLHAATVNWVIDRAQAGGNLSWTIPSSNDFNWNNDTATSTLTSETSIYTEAVNTSTAAITSAAADTDFAAIQGIRFGPTTFGTNAVANRQRGHLMLWSSSSNWGIYEFERNGGNTYSSTQAQADLTFLYGAGNIGANGTTINCNVGWNQFCLGSTHTNTQLDYLKSVSFEPTQTSGSTLNVFDTTWELDSEVSAGDFFNGVSMDSTSEIEFNGHPINFNIAGSGTVSGLRTGSAATSAIAADGVAFTGGTMELARGSSYYINNDVSAMTLSATGSSNNATIYLGPQGVVPTGTLTNIVVVKQLQITSNVAIPTNGRIDVYNYTGNTLVSTTPIASFTPTNTGTSFTVDSVSHTAFTSAVTTVRIVYSAPGGYLPPVVDVSTSTNTSTATINWTANVLYNSAAAAISGNTPTFPSSPVYTGRITVTVPHTYNNTSGAEGQRWICDQFGGNTVYNTVVARNGNNARLLITSNTKVQLDPTYWAIAPSAGGIPTGQIPVSNRSGYTGSLSIFTEATNTGSYTVQFSAPLDTTVDYGAITADAQNIADEVTTTVETEHTSLLNDITAEFIAAQD